MPNSELSKYVYAILDQGQVIIATLDEEEDQNRMDHRPTVTQLDTGHKYPAAMIFPATPANYDALQVLYEDIKVPPIPMEPRDLALELLNHQDFVLIKISNASYDAARAKPDSRMLVMSNNRPWRSVGGSYKHIVPYDVYGIEITSLDYVKGNPQC